MRDEDLDTRIEEAFRVLADDAPRARAGDLVWTARRRLRRRRQAVIGTAAVAVAAVALGGSWSAIGNFSTESNSTASGGSAGSAAEGKTVPEPREQSDLGTGSAPGWRWESFGGVEISVPATWSYGISNAPWCVAGEPGQPDGEVGRPGPLQRILCNDPVPVNKLGQHVWFSRDAGAKPVVGRQLGDGWVLDVVVVRAGVSIAVQTHANPALRKTILASVRQVATDLNGCPATQPVNSTGWVRPTQGLDWSSAVTALSICRYDTRTADWSLIASAGKDQAGANRVLESIRSAPAGGGPDDAKSLPDLGSELTVLRFRTAGGVREVYLRYDGYRHNGFDNGTEMRRLTRRSGAFMTGPLVIYGGPQVTVSLLPRR
jgi:hypothetical protein